MFFLLGKKDKIEFLTDKYKQPKKNIGLKGSHGFVCQIKYHSYLGWMYNIDCLSGFIMVKSKDVKRLSRGWISNLKLRFTSIEDMAKKEEQDKQIKGEQLWTEPQE